MHGITALKVEFHASKARIASDYSDTEMRSATMVFPAKRGWCLNTVAHAFALIMCGAVFEFSL
jgi:hypothetical protein